MNNPLGGLTTWVTDIVESFGYAGVAVLTLLENLVPPIPSEIILPLAGFLVGQGRFSFLPVVLAATIGSVGGAVILYAVGAWLGERRIRYLIDKFGRFILVSEDDLDKSSEWFRRHGSKAIFFGRLIPGIRSIISIPAGIVRMPLGTFVTYSAAGSLFWNAALIGAGWWLGDQWHRLEDYIGTIQNVVLLILVCAVLWFIWSRRDRIRRVLRSS